MPITRDEAGHLAELLCTIRPTWALSRVLTDGLRPLASHPAPLEVIAWAVIRAAKSPAVLHPSDLPINGAHWALADRPDLPDVVANVAAGTLPAEPEHVDPQADLGGAPLADARTRAREALARARGEEPPPAPVVVPEQPPPPSEPSHIICPSCHRDLDRDVAANDCQMPDTHPQPGTLPHHAGHPDHTAEWLHRHPWRRGMDPTNRRRSAQADAGDCLSLRWEPCRDGTAHLIAVCHEPAGHHDRHAGADLDVEGDTQEWDRTQDHPAADWCDCPRVTDPVNPADGRTAP